MAGHSKQLVVYSRNPPISGGDLVRISKECGLEVRLFAFGVFPIVGDDTRLTKPLDDAFLMAMWPTEKEDLTNQVNQIMSSVSQAMVSDDVRESLECLLKQGALPWLECYVRPFNAPLEFLRLSEQLKTKLSPDDFQRFLSSKSRYIFANKSRRKNAQQLMARFAEAVAASTDGLFMNLVR